MIPRFGEPKRVDTRYKMRPGVYALLPRGHQVLLTLQADPLPELQLPGGGIDPGESPLATLHREVYEETGWRIRPMRKIGAFRRFTFMPDYDLWAEKLCHIYLARPIRKMGEPTEPWHMPVWLEIGIAAEVLGNQGDRYFAQQMTKAYASVSP